MIEREIYRILSKRVQELVDDRKLLLRALQMLEVDDVEAERVADQFARKAPKVQHAYPRVDVVVPVYSVILGRRRKSTQFIGEHGTEASADEAAVLGEDRLEGGEVNSSIKEHVLKIWTVTDDPDFTVHYDGLLDFMLDRSLTELLEFGFLSSTMSTGDLSPMESYMPPHLFLRETTFTLELEFDVYGDAQRSPPRTVDVYAEDIPGVGRIRPRVSNSDPPAGASDLELE